MSRKNRAPVREILPDPVFGSKSLAKFINYVMLNGKKSVAAKSVYKALRLLKKRLKGEGKSFESLKEDELLEKAIDAVKPTVEVKSRRVGGATYQVPNEVRPMRAGTLAMRWIISAARGGTGKNMAERLAGALADAVLGRGVAVKKRDDTHKMAEANKAFAHYRW